MNKQRLSIPIEIEQKGYDSYVFRQIDLSINDKTRC